MNSKSSNTPSIVSTTDKTVDKYLLRFIDKLEDDPATGCMLYTAGACLETGYGIYNVRGKSTLAHRYAFESYYGTPCPADKIVGHSSLCKGRRNCCNPLHLSAITHKENSAQRVIDGTMNVPHRPYRKCSDAEVEDIRNSYAKGETIYQIAKRLQRGQCFVAKVVRNELHDPSKPPAKKGPKPDQSTAKLKEVA